MGIRFFCPHGHRLNVKSFLAGKRGVCPDCGAPVDIPMESDARAVSSKKKSKAAGGREDSGNGNATAVLEQTENDRPEIDISLPAPQVPAHNDFALPVEAALPPAAGDAAVATPQLALKSVRPVPAASLPSNGVPPPTVTASSGAAVAVPVAPGAPVPSVVVDPISEAPMAVWYVLPPSGGQQYGPARGDVMRKWIVEGRVTTNSLVWREGWKDWLPASKVFPNLGSKSSANTIAPVLSDAPRRPIRPARKSSTSQGVAIVITLGVVCLALFTALIWVLMSNTTAAPTPP